MSTAVELDAVTKSFRGVAAVRDVCLTVEAGEFLTLLGPSGCGKTTLLRLIAGFEQPESGTIRLGGAEVTHLPPYQRNVNQVFQSYALFPHLTVRANIAFGLRMQRLPAGEIMQRVNEAIRLVALSGLEERLPHQLSGGQQQRVALARALAPRPAVLLLDEPLAALDAQLRRAMQLELKQLQRRLGATFVFVTHDQAEALIMSDRIALMQAGRIEQIGSPREIYDRPATGFAAEFIGQANLLPADFAGADGDVVTVQLAGGLRLRVIRSAWPEGVTRALVAIRPERLQLTDFPVNGPNALEAHIVDGGFNGATDRHVLRLVEGPQVVALTPSEPQGKPRGAGDRVWVSFKPDDVVVVPSAHA